MKSSSGTVDDYLAGLNPGPRAALERLRGIIRAAAPKAEECISYQMPAFRLDGLLVSYAAWKTHCALYPMSSAVTTLFRKELQGFDTDKGTIRFRADQPLPATLVRKLVKARIAENSEKRGRRSKTPKSVRASRATSAPRKRGPGEPGSATAERVKAALAALERQSTQRDRQNLERFGITAAKFFGVSMAKLKVLAKGFGTDHALAAALWGTGWYEARLLATLIDDPESVTPAQMDRWCRDFDNWGICDTACFCLFDRTPHAFSRVAAWRKRRAEFEKRAAFALLASLALHDRTTANGPFLEGLRFVEEASTDERNFVRKSVNWALRAIGERNAVLHAAATRVSRRLADSADTTARWIGRDALKALAAPATARRLAARDRARTS